MLMGRCRDTSSHSKMDRTLHACPGSVEASKVEKRGCFFRNDSIKEELRSQEQAGLGAKDLLVQTSQWLNNWSD